MLVKDKLLQNHAIYWHCTLLHRQETAKIKKDVLQCLISFLFSAPEPSVANPIQPQSYLQHYSTSIESKENRQIDSLGIGPEQQCMLVFGFLSVSHPSITT